MKMFLITTAVLLLFGLTSCTNNESASIAPTGAEYTTETAVETTVPQTTESYIPQNGGYSALPDISIYSTYDPTLPAFEVEPVIIDFVDLHVARGASAEDFSWVLPEWGIVIVSDEPLYELQIISIRHDWDSDPLVSYVDEMLGGIGVLPADTPLLLSRFFVAGGVAPMEGISFVDSAGVRHNLGIMDSRMDSEPPLFFVEF